MRWRLWGALAALACGLASLSAQTARPVTFVWDVDDPGDSGLAAEAERNGAAVPCLAFTATTPTERRCTATLVPGPGTFRLRMANAAAAWGAWSDPLTATIPPGAGPGAFTLRFHQFSEAPPMAVTYVASDSDLAFGVTDTFPTISVTPSGSDRLLVIGFSWFDPTNTITITGRVGGSSSGVVADGSVYAFDGDRRHIAIFYMIAPAASSLSIDGVLSASAENLFIGAAAYSGVHQTTPLGTRQNADGGGTSIELALSGGDADGMIAAFGMGYTSTMTSTAGTERWNLSNGGDAKSFGYADAVGASGTISWSQSSAAWGISGNKILPASGGTRRFLLVRP